MQVHAKCFLDVSRDQVCDYHGSRPHEHADGATPGDLAVEVGLHPDNIKLIFVNHKETTLDIPLNEWDQVAFSPY